jgi:phage terminase Nu1 subunit (DNA packaging protein)
VREAYAARLARLEYEERSGKLVSVDVVRVEAFKAHRRVRDAVLNIPDRCAPQLASMTDPAEVHAYLLGEIVEALRMLSADIYRPGVSA